MFGTVVKVVLLPLLVGALTITGYTAWLTATSVGKEMSRPNKEPRPRPSVTPPLTEKIPSGPQPGISTDDDEFVGAAGGSVRPKITGSCKTKECLKLDKIIKERLNENFDPCTDFYKFVCNESDSESESKDELFISDNVITARLKNILDDANSSKDSMPLKVAQDLFKICMKQGTPTSGVDFSELKNMISEVGGWSMQSNWDEKNFSLAGFYEKSVEMGYLPYALFSIDIFQHPDRRDKKIIAITKPNFTESWYGWPIEVVSPIHVNDFSDVIMKNIADNLGISQGMTLINHLQNQQKVKEIANAYAADSAPIVMKLSEIESKWPGIPWSKILRAVFKPMRIDPDQEILVECSDCLTNLANTFVTKDQMTLADYLIWHLIADNIVDNSYDALRITLSIKNIDSKEDYCTLRVSSLFRKAMNYEYVRKYVNRNMETDLMNIIAKLKASFERSLRESKVLDSETRQKALEKLSSMKFYTPYDAEVSDKKEVIQYYANMQANLQSSFFRSLASVRKEMIKLTINSFEDNRPIRANHNEYWKNYIEYDHSLNAVFISAGVLEGLTFSRNLPNYLNYAVVGSIIGREIARAFSAQGRKYDGNGKKNDWWSQESKDEQDTRVLCFLNEYYKYNNLTIDEKLKAEIISNSDGMEMAYNAYVNTPINLPVRDEKLPSFRKWANRQMFWITFASGLCSNEPEEGDDHILRTDLLNTAVLSSREFTRDFECKTGSDEKCSLWS